MNLANNKREDKAIIDENDQRTGIGTNRMETMDVLPCITVPSTFKQSFLQKL